MSDSIRVIIRFDVNENKLEKVKDFFKNAIKKEKDFKHGKLYAVLADHEQWTFGEMDYTATLTPIDYRLNRDDEEES